MLLITIFFLSLFFLAGSFFLTSMISALRTIQRREASKKLKSIGPSFFYRPFHLLVFPESEYEGMFFSAICAQNVARFCYAAFAVIFLASTNLYHEAAKEGSIGDFQWFWLFLSFFCFLLMSFVIGDYFPRILGTRLPQAAMRLAAPVASLFMFLAFPITFVFLKLSQSLTRLVSIDHIHEPSAQVKQEIIEIIQEAQVGPTLDLHDKKLIGSVLTFRERIAREVMVPRVDMFSLSAETTIQEAAQILIKEGYSRTPIYKESVDNVVGVLMYKDILNKYMEYATRGHDPKILLAPIESIQKNVMYTPETKKLSSLLQEFRKKQVHLAIVVDEYGGTEGIVTIEDILEEIVGDIADEYDEEQESFRKLPDGSWIVDARMNILDVDDLIGINIPQESDYDTLGGYIYHSAGSIPSKGFTIHHDDFELLVLSSNPKSVEKVRIRPLKTDNESKT